MRSGKRESDVYESATPVATEDRLSATALAAIWKKGTQTLLNKFFVFGAATVTIYPLPQPQRTECSLERRGSNSCATVGQDLAGMSNLGEFA